MANETLYSSETKVRIEPAVKAAIWSAARSFGIKPAEYIRMALRATLKADNVPIADPEVPTWALK